jgi:hypothetical protein
MSGSNKLELTPEQALEIYQRGEERARIALREVRAKLGKHEPAALLAETAFVQLRGYQELVSEAAKLRQRRFEEIERRLDVIESQGIKFMGVYQRAIEYGRGSVVVRDGSSWVCIDEITRQVPGEGAAWALLAKAGRDASGR